MRMLPALLASVAGLTAMAATADAAWVIERENRSVAYATREGEEPVVRLGCVIPGIVQLRYWLAADLGEPAVGETKGYLTMAGGGKSADHELDGFRQPGAPMPGTSMHRVDFVGQILVGHALIKNLQDPAYVRMHDTYEPEAVVPLAGASGPVAWLASMCADPDEEIVGTLYWSGADGSRHYATAIASTLEPDIWKTRTAYSPGRVQAEQVVSCASGDPSVTETTDGREVRFAVAPDATGLSGAPARKRALWGAVCRDVWPEEKADEAG